MSLKLGQRAFRASLSGAQHVQLQQRALTRLTGRVNQEAHAEENVSQRAALDRAGSRQNQGNTGGGKRVQEDHARAPALNGSSDGLPKPMASATAQPQQPARAFTWLNRHHDSSAAQQNGARDAQARSGRLTQSARQTSGKLSSTAPMSASQQLRRQPESEASSQQPQPDSRAFKSTDAGWRSDSTYWKTPKPGNTPSSSPRSTNGQSASMPNWVPRAPSPQAAGSQQNARPEQAKSSQAPRLRWLAVGKAPAAGAASATSQAADASKLPASAGAASQAAGEGQPQAPQQAAPSGMADPSRWLSEEGYNTLKWQARMSQFNDSSSTWERAKQEHDTSIDKVMKRDWMDNPARQGNRLSPRPVMSAQDRRRTSQDFGSPNQRYNQPQYPGQQGQTAPPAATQGAQAFWEQQQQQEAQQESGSVQEPRSSGQQPGNQELLGQQTGSRQPSGQHPRQAPQAQPKRKVAPLPQPKAPREISLPQDVTARQLAALLGCKMPRLEAIMEEMGERIESEEDVVPLDVAELAALELGQLAVRSADAKDKEADAVPRPPVVTVMGHVDHGKTSLLDALRKTSVAAGEAGGITQHIGAFEVTLPGSKGTATFLDTPGHAAFSAMRARGAQVTDIVILVVAANDGVMPQTREALQHAQQAGCPIILALTKCDMPGADPERVKMQLLSAGLLLEEAGGNVMAVETAAPTGQGLTELEEAILLQAEMMDLKASQTGAAEGTTVEARMTKGQGPVATVIVKRGALKVGDNVAIGLEWGRIRSMRDPAGRQLKEALPGQPVEVMGLRGVPQAGDDLIVVPSEERARRISTARSARVEDYRWSRMAVASRQLLEQRQAAEAAAAESGEASAVQERAELSILVKADVQGSAEAVRDAVQALSSETIGVKVVAMGVGPVSASDVLQANAVGADIIAFNVKTAGADVDTAIKKAGVEMMSHRVIYSLLDEVVERMTGAAPRVEQQKVVGEAQVLQVFEMPDKRQDKRTTVAGCRVSEGSIRAGATYKVLRGGDVVHEGVCASLKRHRLDVERVGKGTECGVLLEGFAGFQQGDVLQCIETEMVAPGKESLVPQAQAQHA
ncbi:g12268 [Coccomyxa viridis]|uniref:Translation initiation factor IF-2, mitochondrial n=1 Tax=Coccomyxa viridis TaxID=1274662 RepID=A0ABP1GCL6_9CHLO